jgi:hypothetical protein
VALSRLRSLDGLILRAPIHTKAISTDKNIVHFTQTNHKPHELVDLMKIRQRQFIQHVIQKAFDLSPVLVQFKYLLEEATEGITKNSTKHPLHKIIEAIASENGNTEKFRRQLKELFEGDHDTLVMRIESGSAYYFNFLLAQLKLLLQHQEETRMLKRVKTYLNQLIELDVVLSRKIKEIDKTPLLTKHILTGDKVMDDASLTKHFEESRTEIMTNVLASMPSLKDGKKQKKKKGDKSTYDITRELIVQGMSVSEIAAHRGLAVSTIEGHLAKAIASRAVSITSIVSDEQLAKIESAILELPEGYSSKDLYDLCRGEYSYGILRAVMSHKSLHSLEVK